MSVDVSAVLLAKLTGQDIPRDEPRVRVRVLTLSDQLIVAGVRFAAAPDAKPTPVQGTPLAGFQVEAEVYESDVATLERHVEDKLDAQSVQRVETDMRSDLDAWTEERVRGLEGDAADRARKDAARSFPGSFQGYFRRAFKRDMRPLVKVERVPEKTKKAA